MIEPEVLKPEGAGETNRDFLDDTVVEGTPKVPEEKLGRKSRGGIVGAPEAVERNELVEV